MGICSGISKTREPGAQPWLVAGTRINTKLNLHTCTWCLWFKPGTDLWGGQCNAKFWMKMFDLQCRFTEKHFLPIFCLFSRSISHGLKITLTDNQWYNGPQCFLGQPTDEINNQWQSISINTDQYEFINRLTLIIDGQLMKIYVTFTDLQWLNWYGLLSIGCKFCLISQFSRCV